jgi:hypothetical protein
MAKDVTARYLRKRPQPEPVRAPQYAKAPLTHFCVNCDDGVSLDYNGHCENCGGNQLVPL